MIPGTVRLTPEQRAELDQAIGRLIVWLARVLHIPWWASVLLLLAILAGACIAATRQPKKRASTPVQRRSAVDTRPVLDLVFCGHCGHICPPARRAVRDSVPLCFATPTDARNCFALVTTQGHKPDGSCCTTGGR